MTRKQFHAIYFRISAFLLVTLIRHVNGQEATTDSPLEETTAASETTVVTGETGAPNSQTNEGANATGLQTTTFAATTAPSTRPPRECLNLHPLCIFWKIHGECTKNADFMEFYCRKTCRKCDSYPSSADIVLPNQAASLPCGDDQDLCVFWSKRDQCNRNFYWMLQHCPFSCGYCSTKCRPCPPPSDVPLGVLDLPKLFLGQAAVQRGGIDSVDFTNYQPDEPPEAFGLHGDPERFGRRRKRGKLIVSSYQAPPRSKKHHHHGSGIGWTDLPTYGHGCNTYEPQKCATVAPLPCCIPVALAEAQGILPLGAYVTPITPPTPELAPILSLNGPSEEKSSIATTKLLVVSASPVTIGRKTISTAEGMETTFASQTEEVENTEPAATEPIVTSTAGGEEEIPSAPSLQSTPAPAPEAPTEEPGRLNVNRKLRKSRN